MQDWKTWDQIAGVENAGLENDTVPRFPVPRFQSPRDELVEQSHALGTVYCHRRDIIHLSFSFMKKHIFVRSEKLYGFQKSTGENSFVPRDIG